MRVLARRRAPTLMPPKRSGRKGGKGNKQAAWDAVIKLRRRIEVAGGTRILSVVGATFQCFSLTMKLKKYLCHFIFMVPILKFSNVSICIFFIISVP